MCRDQLMRKKITELLFKSQVPSWVRVAIQFWACSSLGKTSLSAVLCWFFCYLAFSFFFQWHGFMGMKLSWIFAFKASTTHNIEALWKFDGYLLPFACHLSLVTPITQSWWRLHLFKYDRLKLSFHLSYFSTLMSLCWLKGLAKKRQRIEKL